MGSGSSLEREEESLEEPEVETGENKAFISSVGKSIASKLGYGEKSEFEQGLDECCPSLTFQQRIWGFAVTLLLGMAFSYISGFYIVRPKKFAFIYTLGNLLSLSSTMFLTGPISQFKRMFHTDRAIASIIYLCSMLLTLVVALRTGKMILVFPLIFIQWLALFWYSLSYIPFGRKILSSIVSFCCHGICDQCQM
ncbi:hypothetical protein AAMO2058_000585200 [Amorphochlora amoebiformis]